MPVELSRPDVAGLAEAARAMQGWQRDDEPVPLHPGDLGWHWRFGAAATAAKMLCWHRDGQMLAVGLLDGPVLRLGVAPDAMQDDALARAMVADVSDPEVFPGADASVEARFDGLLVHRLRAAGWTPDEPWTPLRRDLTAPVQGCGLRVEVTTPDDAQARVAVHRAAFDRSAFTVEQWHAMAAGPLYGDAECLVGYDEHDIAVAAATVWSAGPGRPGLIEPLGVHREHRGHGYGRAITVAAASALRELGSSSASVCTPSANAAGVAAYVSAGFEALPRVRDLRRPG